MYYRLTYEIFFLILHERIVECAMKSGRVRRERQNLPAKVKTRGPTWSPIDREVGVPNTSTPTERTIGEKVGKLYRSNEEQFTLAKLRYGLEDRN